MTQRTFMKNLSILFRHRHRAVRSQLEKYDIGLGEWAILGLLSKYREGMEQTEIARELGLDKTTTARELKSLEKKEYVIRKPDESDRRKKIVFSTEKADENVPRVKDAGKKWLEAISEDISEEDIVTFDRILNQMLNNSWRMIEGVERDE